MLTVGQHDYHYFNHAGTTLLLTIGDCENRAARQFINSIPEHMFDQLTSAIGNCIWNTNEFNVQNEVYMTYLSGQSATQRFINLISTETSFFDLMPFDRVCLSYITFLPFHDYRCRWEIELDFGHTSEFHTNVNPHRQLSNNDNQPQLLE